MTKACAGLMLIALLLASPHAAGPQRPSRAEAVAQALRGKAALDERRFADALEAFTAAAAAEPRDASLSFGAGLAAHLLGQQEEARTWLERTIRLQPSLTAASQLLGEMQYAAGDVAGAIATYEAALARAPGQEQIASRLTEWRRDRQVTSGFYEAQGAHFTVRFEGPADQALARRAVDMLEAAYWQIGSRLSTYPPSPITVVLYTQAQFRDTTRSPGWAGGMYDGRIRVPMRGALDQPSDLERVLAHEYVHAVVASIGGRRVPVWINEGLATVLQPGGADWTEQLLSRTDVRLPLRLLQRSFAQFTAEQAALAYAESAAAVEKIIDLRGAPALVSLLREVGRGVPFETAFHQNVAMRYAEFEAALR